MFPVGSYVMRSDDESLAGIVELNGKTTILDSKTGNVLAVGNVAQYRVAPQELNGLSDVLLLQDADHYYIALNRPLNRQKVVVNNQTGKPEVYNNFTNGTHCHSVNGWFVALHKTDGQRTISGKDVKWSKGDMAWHSQTPIENQMIVLEQFEQMPVVLFSSRYNEIIPNNGGLRWPCVTQALSKASGLWVHDSTNYGNSNPWYSELKVDLKSRTINLVSSNKSVQVYVDDGKGPPAFPQGAFLQQPNPYDPTSPYGAFNPYGQPPVAVPPINGLAPGARIMRAPVPRLDVVPVDPKKRD
jgi:hypothetical protein